MNEQVIYETTGSLDLYRKEKGLELKSVQRNGKNYIILSGTPEIIDGNVYIQKITLTKKDGGLIIVAKQG